MDCVIAGRKQRLSVDPCAPAQMVPANHILQDSFSLCDWMPLPSLGSTLK